MVYLDFENNSWKNFRYKYSVQIITFCVVKKKYFLFYNFKMQFKKLGSNMHTINDHWVINPFYLHYCRHVEFITNGKSSNDTNRWIVLCDLKNIQT